MIELSSTTQVALLLTARWAAKGVKPLTNSEFADFRRWLGSDADSSDVLLQGKRDFEGSPIEHDRLKRLLERGLGVFQSVDRWRSAGIWVSSWGDAAYPSRFKQLKHRAPVLVFGYGNPNAFGDRALAIVGSRNAADERLNRAAEVGRVCAKSGVTVVSGGARGVDSSAMLAGMTEAGTVVGVLAEELLRESGRKVYRDAILENRLCLMSEMNPEAHFDVGAAMARNRLAYACADAALVVESDAGRGGTWAGALDALKEGKAVYVLEGARAENELETLGAIVVSISFALKVDQLLLGERPAAGTASFKATQNFVVDLLKSNPSPEKLADYFRSSPESVAEDLYVAAGKDGIVQAIAAKAHQRGGSKASNPTLFGDAEFNEQKPPLKKKRKPLANTTQD